MTTPTPSPSALDEVGADVLGLVVARIERQADIEQDDRAAQALHMMARLLESEGRPRGISADRATQLLREAAPGMYAALANKNTRAPVSGAEREAGRVVYMCQDCGAAGVRLYREYQTFLDHQRLRCTACALARQGLTEPDGPHTIGWLVAAVPTEGGETYWGYTSVPEAGVKWWEALPVKLPSPRGSR